MAAVRGGVTSPPLSPLHMHTTGKCLRCRGELLYQWLFTRRVRQKRAGSGGFIPYCANDSAQSGKHPTSGFRFINRGQFWEHRGRDEPRGRGCPCSLNGRGPFRQIRRAGQRSVLRLPAWRTACACASCRGSAIRLPVAISAIWRFISDLAQIRTSLYQTATLPQAFSRLGDSQIGAGVVETGKLRMFAMGQAIAVRQDGFRAAEVAPACDTNEGCGPGAAAPGDSGDPGWRAASGSGADPGGMDRQTLRDSK